MNSNLAVWSAFNVNIQKSMQRKIYIVCLYAYLNRALEFEKIISCLW